jgi:hypothetical protein
MARCGGQSDSLHLGLVPRVGAWGLGSFLVLSLAALLWDRPLGGGVLVGGGLTLALFALYRVLAPAMLGDPTARRSRVLFWVVWALKWPVLGGALFFSLRGGFATPLGLALGAAILPAVATGFALRALLADAWAHGRGGVQTS